MTLNKYLNLLGMSVFAAAVNLADEQTKDFLESTS